MSGQERLNLIGEISDVATRLNSLVGSISGVDFESINKAAYASDMILKATDMISQIDNTTQDERDVLFGALKIFKNVAGFIRPYMDKVDEAMKVSTVPEQYNEVVNDVNQLTSEVQEMNKEPEPMSPSKVLEEQKKRTLAPNFGSTVQVV